MSKPNDLIDLRFEMADDLTWRSFMFLLRQFLSLSRGYRVPYSCPSYGKLVNNINISFEVEKKNMKFLQGQKYWKYLDKSLLGYTRTFSETLLKSVPDYSHAKGIASK